MRGKKRKGTMMSSSGSKMERKTIEKNRRIEMKHLCFNLVSLVPTQHFNPLKEFLSQPDQIGQAADYIKKLSARIEKLKKIKAQASTIAGDNDTRNKVPSTSKSELLPVFSVRDLGSSLDVILISGLHKKFKLHQVIRLLEEEGTEVVGVSLSYNGDKIFHTLHTQVKVARIGVDTSRICGRLGELISQV